MTKGPKKGHTILTILASWFFELDFACRINDHKKGRTKS